MCKLNNLVVNLCSSESWWSWSLLRKNSCNDVNRDTINICIYYISFISQFFYIIKCFFIYLIFISSVSVVFSRFKLNITRAHFIRRAWSTCMRCFSRRNTCIGDNSSEKKIILKIIHQKPRHTFKQRHTFQQRHTCQTSLPCHSCQTWQTCHASQALPTRPMCLRSSKAPHHSGGVVANEAARVGGEKPELTLEPHWWDVSAMLLAMGGQEASGGRGKIKATQSRKV